MPSASEWHNRFVHQASWTAAIRRYLTADLQLEAEALLLDVGCGTGALFPAIKDLFPDSRLHGADLNHDFLRLAKSNTAMLCQGNALALPYAAGTFDLVYCHFFLLWLSNPKVALAEMIRVARPAAFVMAFAEPDYGARIDYPPALKTLGKLQQQALDEQGADTLFGRKLAAEFSDSGLVDIQVGILGGQWTIPEIEIDESEQWALEQDLSTKLPPEELQQFLEIDRQARAAGERTLFIPTFYARGRKPG